eukprot:3617185-Pleurochrysis_carterae.AAC.3
MYNDAVAEKPRILWMISIPSSVFVRMYILSFVARSKVEAVRAAVGALMRKTLREFRGGELVRARKQTNSPLYTDKAKPLQEHRILEAEYELRQRGAGRRDRDLGADCVERKSSS